MPQKRPVPKWLKWEFWPFEVFYLPVAFLVMVHALRARTLAYFTLANPGMRMGGFSSYSKYEILSQLSSKYLPKTILFDGVPALPKLLAQMQAASISFPIILKPDAGERGWKVEKITDEAKAAIYLQDAPQQLLLQEYIDLPEEYGVMYYRYPDAKSGRINSLMKRQFLSVTGDGQATLLELFQQNERCLYHLDRMKQKYRNELHRILPEGELKVLEEIGNHNRGTTFIDAHSLISDELITAFDNAGSTLHEFYFGRFDVRTASFEELIKGNFKVIEINGANSEPAHIYDPDMSLLKAYGDLFRHWNIMFRISMQNRRRGFHAPTTGALYKVVRQHLKEKKAHPNKIA